MAQADWNGLNTSNGFDDLQASDNTESDAESDTEFDSSWKTIGSTRRYKRNVNRPQNVLRETTAVSHPANVKDTKKPVSHDHDALQYGVKTGNRFAVLQDSSNQFAVLQDSENTESDIESDSYWNRAVRPRLFKRNGSEVLSDKVDDREQMWYKLFFAILVNNIEEVRTCISQGVDFTLMNALCPKDDEYANELNVPDMRFRPIALACFLGHGEILEELLKYGANRHISPAALIKQCKENDHVMLARILDTCDLDIDMIINKGGLGMTILQFALNRRDINTRTVQILLDHGADVRAVSNTGDTALHFAVYNPLYYATYCYCSKIRQLLSYNPPLNVKNNENQTPLAKLILPLQRLTEHLQPRWFRARILAFKMLVIAGGNVSPEFAKELDQIRIKHPETQIPVYEAISTRSLKEMCRSVIRETIPVPVDLSLGKLLIPKELQEYLNFPEIDPLVDEYRRCSKVEDSLIEMLHSLIAS